MRKVKIFYKFNKSSVNFWKTNGNILKIFYTKNTNVIHPLKLVFCFHLFFVWVFFFCLFFEVSNLIYGVLLMDSIIVYSIREDVFIVCIHVYRPGISITIANHHHEIQEDSIKQNLPDNWVHFQLFESVSICNHDIRSKNKTDLWAWKLQKLC